MANRKFVVQAFAVIAAFGPCAVFAEEIGSVDTEFKLIGPDHKVIVEAFDDASVKGVACYVSRAKTGASRGDWARE